MGRVRKKVHPKKRTAAFKAQEPSELVEAPHTFIIHRGLSCPYITDLTLDFRRIMEPFTASSLKEKKINRIKDFVNVSGFFHITHMGIFNKASTQLSFKVLRMPRGPTLTFKVHQFTLARDVLSTSRHQFVDEDMFKFSPLVVMNNFTGDGKHLKLMAHTFQNMFPPINLTQVNIATIRRCVLFSYNPLTKLVEMRHYTIQVHPVGLSRGVKKLVMGKIPNMAKCEDIADFIMNGTGAASESEFEDDEKSQVVMPQTIKRKGNLEDNKSAIKLHEIGPRLTLQLIKIEDGLLTGEVLYHDHIQKTEEEKEALRKMVEKKRKLKEYRKKKQTENRERNLKNKTKSNKQTDAADNEDKDDIEYYKEEVGEEPDEELFKGQDTSSSSSLKRPASMPASLKYKNKKFKKDTEAKSNKAKPQKKQTKYHDGKGKLKKKRSLKK